jgi:hypothetical protein
MEALTNPFSNAYTHDRMNTYANILIIASTQLRINGFNQINEMNQANQINPIFEACE